MDTRRNSNRPHHPHRHCSCAVVPVTLWFVLLVLLLLCGEDGCHGHGHAHAHAHGRDNDLTVEECRDRGFDPSNLSCETCSVVIWKLPSSSVDDSTKRRLYETCQFCCAEWRIHSQSEQHGQMYEYEWAAIVHGERMSMDLNNDVSDFWKQDLPMLIQQKKKNALRVIPTRSNPLIPPTLFLFKDVSLWSSMTSSFSSLSAADEQSLMEQADETIVLSEWKRDDMKALIEHLLPDHNV